MDGPWGGGAEGGVKVRSVNTVPFEQLTELFV